MMVAISREKSVLAIDKSVGVKKERMLFFIFFIVFDFF